MEIKTRRKAEKRPRFGGLTIRAAVCGGAFLLCLGFKLLFPAAAESFGSRLCAFIDGDGEYVEAISRAGSSLRSGDGITEAFGELTGEWL